MDRPVANQGQTVVSAPAPAQHHPEPCADLTVSLVGDTAARLVERIHERFTDCELKRLAQKVEQIPRQAPKRVRRPYWLGFFLRVVIYPIVLAGLAALGYGIYTLNLNLRIDSAIEFFQGVEAIIQVVLVIAAGSWFLLSFSNRVVRHRLLKAVQELRTAAHEIDMHQLDKDPDRLTRGKGDNTPNSPQLGAVSTPFLLSRYLDYCSEMLALLGKVAALYSEQVSDPIVLAELDSVVALTNAYRQNIGTKMASISATGSQKAPR